jgi:hypothetical protein
MLHYGRQTHNNRAVFLWVRGGYYGIDYGKSKYYGFGLWEVKILWVRIMEVTLVLDLQFDYLTSMSLNDRRFLEMLTICLKNKFKT